MISTPYYLIDKTKLQNNMKIIKKLTDLSGAKALLALKCFACWSVFDLMSETMHGTTSSSLYEVRLGKEKFKKETHAYSVAYADHEIDEVIQYADKIIFNTSSQLKKFMKKASHLPKGLRINPLLSISNFSLADPACRYSRLGESEIHKIEEVLSYIDGFMIHNNCENDNFERFDQLLTKTEEKFSKLFEKVKWISLGGGIHFTKEGYPLEKLAERLKNFRQKYQIKLFLEPGEAAITNTTTLEVTVLDIVKNEKQIAIVDSSIEAHMLDLLIYRESAKIKPNQGNFEYIISGKSCLAGDVFGTFFFPEPLKVGDRLSIQDAAGYTMVKKNWFNGVNMPSIVLYDQDKKIKIQKEFTYDDYKNSLS